MSFGEKMIELPKESDYSFLLTLVSGNFSNHFYERNGIALPALLEEFEIIDFPDGDDLPDCDS
jgi:hypothetical protein